MSGDSTAFIGWLRSFWGSLESDLKSHSLLRTLVCRLFGFPSWPLSLSFHSGYSLGIPSSAPGHPVHLQPLLILIGTAPGLWQFSFPGRRTCSSQGELPRSLEVQSYPNIAASLSSHQAAALSSTSAFPEQESDLRLQSLWSS